MVSLSMPHPLSAMTIVYCFLPAGARCSRKEMRISPSCLGSENRDLRRAEMPTHTNEQHATEQQQR